MQAEAQAQRILQATEAVDEMSEVAQTVALNAATGTEIAGTARRNASQGSQAVRDTVDGMTRTPLVTIDLVIGRPRPPRAGGLVGLGDFGDVRQLRLWEPRS